MPQLNNLNRLLEAINEMDNFIHVTNHIPWNNVKHFANIVNKEFFPSEKKEMWFWDCDAIIKHYDGTEIYMKDGKEIPYPWILLEVES